MSRRAAVHRLMAFAPWVAAAAPLAVLCALGLVLRQWPALPEFAAPEAPLARGLRLVLSVML